MAEVTSLRALLVDCLQDLREGEAATLERLPAIVDAASSARLKGLLQDRMRDARRRAEALDDLAERLGTSARGPKNIWMGSMLEDAGRDTEMVEPGPLLDIALVGAVRKMVVAARVSYDTAVEVSRRLGDEDATAVFLAAFEQEGEADRGLHGALMALCEGAVAG